jgi:hypothetical protein
MHNRGMLDCDNFESKYERKVWRIRRDLMNLKRPSVSQMVFELWQRSRE